MSKPALTDADLQEIAVVLHRQEKLSLDRAARVAGMDEWSFNCLLAAREAPMHYQLAAFERDLAALRRLAST